MAELSDGQLFESDKHGRQRSVVFAIVLATGFLAVVAGVATLMAEANIAVAVGLLAVGAALLAVAGAIAIGELDAYLFE
ncbi:hypothetical protein [Halapricum hydrolyticum]|uniref:Uncharacterized protein n=1 Tax=Halapricum hydrolyticum TaxID=2979991 RepID=A0AAE3ICG3_9EURY|nr:hypothetical protein [Halapricum hydrolyticum]MCU4718455.1 hypothetical protein [Halapricum hydrolyticum]MCU4727526.1 hypothetical protein [Halapricum hydrolyticum]